MHMWLDSALKQEKDVCVQILYWSQLKQIVELDIFRYK